MDVQTIIQVLMVVVTLLSPFLLKNVSLKGPQMAWLTFGVSSVMAVIAMAVAGSFAHLTVPATPETVLPVLAAFWALQQGTYQLLKDKFLL